MTDVKVLVERYPYLQTMTAKDVLEADVMDEYFNIPFVAMLEKWIEEDDDITHMEIIKKAKALLKAINEY